MSFHIEAKEGAVARAALLPGDPLRARFIADTFLENAVCYNRRRGMLGFTGLYKGRPVSVQGTGMGAPSISIYANELFRDYGVKRAIRVGTAGALRSELPFGGIVIALAACSDSSSNRLRFGGRDFAPAANFRLLQTAYKAAVEREAGAKVGTVVSTDTFYNPDAEAWKRWAEYGVLAVEMETAELYTLAARFGVEAVSVLAISDSVPTGKTADPKELARSLRQTAIIALECAISEASYEV